MYTWTRTPCHTPCLPSGAVDMHVMMCKPTVTGTHSLMSTEPPLSCPRTCTRTHAQSAARRRSTCLPSSRSAHTSPPPPAQMGSSAATRPHVHVLGQMLVTREIPSACAGPWPFSVACLSSREGEGQAKKLWPQSEAAHFLRQ